MIGLFIDHIHSLRNQIHGLKEDLSDASDKLSIITLEKAVYTCICEIL